MSAKRKYTTFDMRIHISLKYSVSPKSVPFVQPGYKNNEINAVSIPIREAATAINPLITDTIVFASC